ncbi:Transcriptional regulator, LysR family [Sulfitobacter noctilucicola]|uniref:LysR family glycine cleavage system transcriptional activator n=1 Tax=Sulfitobacter noctilucicola TaxID=1342301 RepID=A0A7W6Q3G7_9RHOB|nr:Transcriptional regulator, LysR family [Sulfitobacter noctilucicola]MBB4173079.1 LysR family glycine cleavage system transcriptional activator [Sulfitobacter noctilucicola]
MSALRAFAAFADVRNVVAAGDALGVSHAAISQQLRVLESHLDTSLLDRSGRSLELTLAGEKLAQALQLGFGAMIDAVEDITGQHEKRPVHISATPTFAASWLMPRLPKFRADYPQVDIMIDPSPKLVMLGSDGIDIAIRYGTGPWPGVEAEMLVQSPMVVVAAPSLVGDAEISDISELAKFPWLEELGTSEATNWHRRFGVPRAELGMVQVPGNLMLDGAREGQGVVVTVRDFVARDIDAGRLREFHVEDKPGAGYHIVTRPGVQRAWVKAFATWLRREAKEAAVSPGQS